MLALPSLTRHYTDSGATANGIFQSNSPAPSKVATYYKIIFLLFSFHVSTIMKENHQ